MGRPSKLTPAIAARIALELARGHSRERAARAAGIGVATLYRWEAADAALAAVFREAAAEGQTHTVRGIIRTINRMGL